MIITVQMVVNGLEFTNINLGNLMKFVIAAKTYHILATVTSTILGKRPYTNLCMVFAAASLVAFFNGRNCSGMMASTLRYNALHCLHE